MAQNQAWLQGSDNVVSWYKEMSQADDAPYYSVYHGKNLLFSYRGQSVEEGAVLLQRNLDMAEQQGNSTVLYIRLHQELSKGQYINEKSPYSASMPFRCCAVEDDALAMYNLGGGGALGRIDQRLRKLEEGGGIGGEEKKEGVMGMLSGLMENPQVGPIIINAAVGAVFGIINKVLPGVLPQVPAMGNPAPSGPAPTMAGIPGDPVKDWDWAVGVLEQADPQLEQDLVRLAEIAIKNRPMFDMLINSLRSM